MKPGSAQLEVPTRIRPLTGETLQPGTELSHKRALPRVTERQDGRRAGVCDPIHDIGEFDRTPPDLRLAALADEQHCVIEYGQLRRLGLGRGAIEHRSRAGRLHRLHRGVYAVGRKTVTREGNWLAAVLACGPHAFLSHRSAAALWGLLRDLRAAIDVTVPGPRRQGSGDIIVHNVRRLHPDDRRRRANIPVTSVARTLLDLAEAVSPRLLAHAIDEAERLGLFDLRAIDALCERNSGRHGLGPLREAIHRYRPTAPVINSDLERRFVEICDAAGLPRPAMNLFVAGYEVDAAWHEHRLVVEVDGYEYHRTRAAFEADRVRDAALQREGFRVLRVTDRRLRDDRAGVAADLRALLETG